MRIVLLETIDYLVSNNMITALDELMGYNLPWKLGETKDGIKYYKLEDTPYNNDTDDEEFD